jgi:DNA polymerase III subunit beta
MSFTIEKKVFFDLLQKVFPIVPFKSSLQILTNVKISILENKVEIMATDLDQSIKAVGIIEGEGNKEITVNARKLFDIVRELHDGQIKIDFDDHILSIESGGSFSCRIAGADARDFPAFPEIPESREITISAMILKDMVQKSSFAVSKDEMKACLCGVLWEIHPEKSGMIATDGHRLGNIFYDEKFNVDETISCIISPKSLLHLVRIFNSEDESMKISAILGEKYVIFKNEALTLCSKLIEGPYPDYEKVIPRNNPKVAIADRIDLQNAVRRVSVLSNQKTHLIKFSFKPSEAEIMVLNREIGGEARQTIAIEYNGTEHSIGFNASYLSEIINMISTPKIRIEMNTQISACLLFPVFEKVEDKKCNETFLIMPLRIMEERVDE